MEYVIRRKKRNDCKQLANVVTIVWNETYKGGILVKTRIFEKLQLPENVYYFEKI